jgi:hypothetical protein
LLERTFFFHHPEKNKQTQRILFSKKNIKTIKIKQIDIKLKKKPFLNKKHNNQIQNQNIKTLNKLKKNQKRATHILQYLMNYPMIN